MFSEFTSDRRTVWLVLLLDLLLATGCCTTVAAAQPQIAYAPAASADKTPPQSSDTRLPVNFQRRTGDLDAMVRAKTIRALVLYSHSSFFYVNGRPRSIFYEALRDFEQFVNQKLHTGKQHVQVTFIPVRPDQLETYLTEGIGDLIAYPITVTPEREPSAMLGPTRASGSCCFES